MSRWNCLENMPISALFYCLFETCIFKWTRCSKICPPDIGWLVMVHVIILLHENLYLLCLHRIHLRPFHDGDGLWSVPFPGLFPGHIIPCLLHLVVVTEGSFILSWLDLGSQCHHVIVLGLWSSIPLECGEVSTHAGSPCDPCHSGFAHCLGEHLRLLSFLFYRFIPE